MRLLSFICLLLLGVSCSGPKKATMESNKLAGTWVPVSQEFAGTALPPAAFQSQTLVLIGDTYTVTAESVDRGTVKYDGNKIDIYGKDGINAGKHFTALYKYENEQLTICYNLTGDSYPENFETKGKPMYFLSVFKKTVK